MNAVIRFISIVVLAVWLPALSAADLERGTRAFENGDYRTARYELEPLANAGNADAQYVIGFMHALGRGYPKDLVQAEKWFILSARGGNQDAPEARDRIATKLSYAQQLEAERLADSFRGARSAQSSGGTGSWAQSPQALPSGRALVAEIQSGLKQLGFDPGVADGLMGRRTRTAIADFQRQVGLRADGEPSQDVLRAIRKAKADGMRAQTPSASRPTRTQGAPRSAEWYFVQQDLSSVMDELRRLLGSSDDGALRRGVEGLVTRSRWPWTDRVFRDDFSKSAGQGGLDWRVIRGEYAIRDGLLSDARARATQTQPSSDKRSGKEEVLDILGQILGAQIERGGSPTRESAPDEIRLAAATSERFLLRARFDAYDVNGGTAFVLQRAANGTPEELRLRIESAAQRLVIEHATPSGARQIARNPLRFESGRRYALEWAQTRNGVMQVAINGQLLVNNARSGLRGGYQSVAWRNLGGSFLLTEVELHHRPR